jgi:hypothetical protein
MAETISELAQYQSDHDILIEMSTEVRLLRQSIDKAADGTKETLTDHERRLRFIERWMWLAIGAVALAEFVITIISTAFRV